MSVDLCVECTVVSPLSGLGQYATEHLNSGRKLEKRSLRNERDGASVGAEDDRWTRTCSVHLELWRDQAG